MSRTHDLQDGTGVFLRKLPTGSLYVVQPTTPTASAVGFAKGCVWVNTAGSVGTILYVNTGSNTSATWTNVV